MCLGASTGKINIDKCSANMPEFSNYICKPNNGMLLSFVFFLPINLKNFERCIVVLEN